MSTAQEDTAGDDVSYSRMLKKLFKVDVEKPPTPGDVERRSFRSRSSMRSAVERPAAHATEPSSITPAPASAPSPFMVRDRQQPASQGNTGSTARRRYQPPPPDPPASFMRSPHGPPATPRRRQRQPSNGYDPVAAGGGAASVAPSGHSFSHSHAPASLPSPGSGINSGSELRFRRTASSSNAGMYCSAADGGGDADRIISPRARSGAGHSNLTYKPLGNVTAEPAAAVQQRRRVALAIATRSGAAAAAAAATAAAAAAAAAEARASWPSFEHSPKGLAASFGLLSLPPGILGDGGPKAGEPFDSGGGDGVGVVGSLGFSGALRANSGSPVDPYDSAGWPLSDWRGGPTLDDTDADDAAAAVHHGRTESGELIPDPTGSVRQPYVLRPMTAPGVVSIRRRTPAATKDGGGGGVAGGIAAAAAAAASAASPTAGGGGTNGTSSAEANRSGGGGGGAKPPLAAAFAPPKQLYMRFMDELAAAEAPMTTVGTIAAAAAAKAAAYAACDPVQPSGPRIPSLDITLLRVNTITPPPGARGSAAGGPGIGSDGKPTRPSGAGSDTGTEASGASGGAAAAAAAAAGGGMRPSSGDGVGSNAAGGGSDDEADDGGDKLSALGAVPASRSVPLPSPRSRTSSFMNGKSRSSPEKPSSAAAGVAAAAAAAANGASTDGTAAAAAAEASEQGNPRRRRSSARGANQSSDGEAAAAAAGPTVVGDTSKALQVGISVAALLEIVRQLGPTQRHASTAEVMAQWLLPPTRNAGCRVLDLIMARVKIPLGEAPPEGHPPPSARGSCSGSPVLHPDRTWFGQPDYYVIHAWSGNFAALVAALREYCVCLNKTPSSTYVWLDVMTFNHHPGRRDKKDIQHCRQAMANCRRALLVVDAMAECLTRLWCMYEVWLAAVASPESSPTRLTLLNAGADWDAMSDSFFRIDLSRCGTYSGEDRARLLEDMIRTTRSGSTAGGEAPGANKASGTTISPYGVVAALPQLSAAVRGALFDAAAADLAEAKRVSRTPNGMLAYLDAVERYAMVRRIAGGHVEAEEQLEVAVAAAMGIKAVHGSTSNNNSGHNNHNSSSNSHGNSQGLKSPAGGDGNTAAGGSGGAAGDAAAAEASSNMFAISSSSGEAGVALPPIGAGGGGTTAATTGKATASAGRAVAATADDDGGTGLDGLAATAAAIAAAAAGGGANSSALWRKKPATLAALAVLQAEHGRVVQALSHVGMALSCIPGLALMRAVPQVGLDDGDDDVSGSGGGSSGRTNHHNSLAANGTRSYGRNDHSLHPRAGDRGDRGGAAGGGGGAAATAASRARSGRDWNSGGLQRHPSRPAGYGEPHGERSTARSTSSPPAQPGVIAWKGNYWELSHPQNTTPEAARAIFMASVVEAACGRHEAAAQLALQAGHARAAALGPAHPATLATRSSAVSHLLTLGRVAEAQLLARSLLKEAVAEHGETHPSVGILHGAMAQVLAAQNKPEQAYSAAQRGAEVLASCLGRGHPCTLDALAQCADMLESVQEYGKAVALMRVVVQGRSAPGAIRASPASPAFLAPNNRLLHLRTVAALEEKAMAEEHSRRAMLGVMRGLAKLEAELRAALMAMSGAAPQVQRDLELVLLAQNKRYEAAMLHKGDLRATPATATATTT